MMEITIRKVGVMAYEATIDGRFLCRSKTPFLAGARVLLAEGVDPTTPLVMRHAGDDAIALQAAVGVAAGLTVIENEKTGPRFSKFVPMDLDARLPRSPTRGDGDSGAASGEVPEKEEQPSLEGTSRVVELA